MKRILVIRLSALGDIIVTLPILSALRDKFVEVEIDWVVEDRFTSLLEEVIGIDRLIVFPRRAMRSPLGPVSGLRHVAQLRGARYDWAIDFQGNLKSASHLRLARSSVKVGLDREHAKENAHRAADIHVAPPTDCHRALRALSLLGPLGIATAWETDRGPLPLPTFRRRPELEQEIRDTLPNSTRRILIHPGTSAFGSFKRLPAETFGEVARRLHRGTEQSVTVTFGPGEEDLAATVVRSSGDVAVPIAPRAGIAGLIATLRTADLFIAADSGPLLLASALGIPTVALFGPKDPATYAPPFARSTVVRSSVPCSPCSLRRCPDPICMTTLDATSIVDAASRLLATPAGR